MHVNKLLFVFSLVKLAFVTGALVENLEERRKKCSSPTVSIYFYLPDVTKNAT